MKKITILALHLGAGGIERAICMLANGLYKYYNIEIVSTYKLDEKPFFKLNHKVKVKYLMEDIKPNREELKLALHSKNIISITKEVIKSIKVLRKKKILMVNYIKNCYSDIIISTRDIHNKWLGKYGKDDIIKIGWEHNHHNNNSKYIKKIINSVKELNYFVLVSNELYDFYKDKVKPKCVYIPNAIDYFPKQLSNLQEKNIISVGRISKEKGYLDLIDVYNLVYQKYPSWHLHIIGDGPEANLLKKKIEDLGLTNNVILHGYQSRDYVNNLLAKSSIYVMTSYTESFGIVLLEAFAFGIPCVAFDSAQGANEIITNNWNGYLVQNRDFILMSKRIMELIKSLERRTVMGDYGYKLAQKYRLSSIINLWLELLNN